MQKIINKYKEHNITFWYFELMILLLITLPKVNFILDDLPIRVGLLALFPIIVFIDYKRKKINFNKFNHKPLTVLYILFLLLTIPSIIVSKNTLISLYTLIKFILFYVFFVLVTKINFSMEERKKIYVTFLIGIIITLIYGFVSYFFDVNLFKLSNYMYPGALGRIRTTFFNPCYYALFLIMVYPLIFYRMCINKNKLSWLYVILLLAILACLIFTFTRSAILIFIMLAILILFIFRKIIFNLKTLVVFGLSVLMLIFIPGSNTLVKNSLNDGVLVMENLTGFLPEITGDEEETSSTNKEELEESDFKDYSLQDREAFANIANQIANDNKFTGVGFGTYIDYMHSKEFDKTYPNYDSKKIHPHSSLILMYAETGILATTIYLLFIICMVLNMVWYWFKSFKEVNKIYYASSLGLLVSFSFMLVGVMSENSMYDTQIFPIYFIIFGIFYNLIINEKENNKKVMFISSTGGHLNELLQLKPLIEKYDSCLITEKTKSNMNLKNKYDRVYYLVYGTRHYIICFIC